MKKGAGFVAAVIGAVIVIAVWAMITRKRAA
ncbi:GlsB/YeaQ/YmgE family stress response membrane protein [Nordella sp. HKS 07]